MLQIGDILIVVLVELIDSSSKLAVVVSIRILSDEDDNICFSFWRLKLRRLHLSDALARCHARRGLIFTGGYA